MIGAVVVASPAAAGERPSVSQHERRAISPGAEHSIGLASWRDAPRRDAGLEQSVAVRVPARAVGGLPGRRGLPAPSALRAAQSFNTAVLARAPRRSSFRLFCRARMIRVSAKSLLQRSERAG